MHEPTRAARLEHVADQCLVARPTCSSFNPPSQCPLVPLWKKFFGSFQMPLSAPGGAPYATPLHLGERHRMNQVRPGRLIDRHPQATQDPTHLTVESREDVREVDEQKII